MNDLVEITVFLYLGWFVTKLILYSLFPVLGFNHFVFRIFLFLARTIVKSWHRLKNCANSVQFWIALIKYFYLKMNIWSKSLAYFCLANIQNLKPCDSAYRCTICIKFHLYFTYSNCIRKVTIIFYDAKLNYLSNHNFLRAKQTMYYYEVVNLKKNIAIVIYLWYIKLIKSCYT